MEANAIRTAVQATLEAIAPGADARRIRADRPVREQIDLDSLDWLNVIGALQERFVIAIPEADYGRLATLDAIVDYVASKCAEGFGAGPRATAQADSRLPTTTHVVNDMPLAVRPIRADDMAREADFVRRLSPDSRYQRFMLSLGELSPAKLRYLTDVDQVRHVALVATVEREGEEALVGVVRYIIDASGTNCEFAIAIDDAWQASGLAGILMHRLIEVARARGLATMEGVVLASNMRMLKFTRQLGFRPRRDPEDHDTLRVVRSL